MDKYWQICLKAVSFQRSHSVQPSNTAPSTYSAAPSATASTPSEPTQTYSQPVPTPEASDVTATAHVNETTSNQVIADEPWEQVSDVESESHAVTIEVEATPIESTVIESETDNSAVSIPDETENENLTDLKTIQTLTYQGQIQPCWT